jgi:APA family basic amino acid/polyamine antiporter
MSTTAKPAAAPPAESGSGFRQELGLFDATMLVVGTMIGSGIFIVSADVARDVGSTGWLLAAWVLAGVMTLLGALCYAELSAMLPHPGGQYVYLRDAFGPLWGFLYGWTLFVVIQTGSVAAVGVAFAKFLGVFVPWLGTSDEALWYRIRDLDIVLSLPLPWAAKPMVFFQRHEFTVHAGQLVAAAVVLFLTYLNCRGVREGKWVQNVFTVAKTLAVVAVVLLGLSVAVNPAAISANLQDIWGGIRGTPRFRDVSGLMPAAAPQWVTMLMVLGGAMVGPLFASDSWNNVTFAAGEVRNPRRNLPLSLACGVGLVVALYLLVNLSYLAVLPISGDPAGVTPVERGIAYAKDDRVATAVMQQVSATWGARLMALAVMISTFGCLNGMILMGARLYFAMARDGLFFQSAGLLNIRGVPAIGLALQSVWSIALIFSGTYSELLDYVIFAALFFYVLTVLGLFRLRRKLPHLERPYRVIGYPVLPAVYAGLCTLIMLDLLIVKPVYTWPGLFLVLSGIPVFFVWRLRGGRTAV